MGLLVGMFLVAELLALGVLIGGVLSLGRFDRLDPTPYENPWVPIAGMIMIILIIILTVDILRAFA